MTARALPAGEVPEPGSPGRVLAAGATPTLGSPWAMAVRGFGSWIANYRRTWRGSIYSSILSPVLYLGAMGLGLGTLVNHHHSASLGGVSYLTFLAPGLLAAGAMQTAMIESTYPVLGSVKWQKTYYATAASPLQPEDVFRGHVLFTTLRLAMNTVIFLVVMAAFGAVRSPWAAATLPVGVLTGLAFATPLEAYSISRKSEQSFAMLFRFGMIPMFLFSGTFFPVSQLPVWIRPVAYATPLWHGVALCRALSLGTATLPAAVGHLAYLVALALVGLTIGTRTYRRRLHV